MMRLVCILFTLAGGYIVAMNWLCIFANMRNVREGIDKHHSLVPVVGPLLMTIGLSKLVSGLGWLLLLPLLIDSGTWILVYSIPFLAKQLVGGRGRQS